MYRKTGLGNFFEEELLDDLQEDLYEIAGLKNQVQKLLKPEKSNKKFKNKIVYE